MLPIVGGAIGGVLGAALWAAVAYFFNFEIGWLAWGIGVLVGIGTQKAADSELNFQTGAAAALIAVVSIAGGKYLAVQFAIDDALTEMAAGPEGVDDELAISYVADVVIEEHLEEGLPVRWPGGFAPENPAYESEYPVDVWREADDRFASLTLQQKNDFKQEIADYVAEAMTDMRVEAQQAGFKESFGMFDILFIALAIGSAFKLGSGGTLREA